MVHCISKPTSRSFVQLTLLIEVTFNLRPASYCDIKSLTIIFPILKSGKAVLFPGWLDQVKYINYLALVPASIAKRLLEIRIFKNHLYA